MGKCSAVEDFARRGASPPLPADRQLILVPSHRKKTRLPAPRNSFPGMLAPAGMSHNYVT